MALGSVHPPLRGMAKQNRYAGKASRQVEVAGRTLRTHNPDFVRELLAVNEERERQSPGITDRFQDRDAYKGAVFEAIRLKQGIA